MTLIRWTVLLGAFAILTTVAVNLPRVAQAQQPEPIQGVYWKANDTKTAQGIPRVASATKVLPHDEKKLPNPYYEVDDFFKGEEAGREHVRWDSHGNIWTLGQVDPPIKEFDPSGKFIKSLGKGQRWFVGPHYLWIDKEDNLYVADNQARPGTGRGNSVTKLSPDGQILLKLGNPDAKGGSPENFMGPVGVTTNDKGEIFVTVGHFAEPDGGGRTMANEYFNWPALTREVTHSRVAVFSKEGKFLRQWGKTGSAPGEFYVPHGIALDSQGRVFVADRGNNRVQIFDQNGKFIAEWKQFGKPVDVFVDKKDTLYVVDRDSIRNQWSWKYSTTGDPRELIQIPRLTDVGSPNPEFFPGIHIGSAKTGEVTAFIPAKSGPEGPYSTQERVTADANGTVFSGPRVLFKKADLPEGAGKQLVEKACSSCHDFRQFPRVNFDHADWAAVVNTMVGGGAALTKAEIPVVVDYLAANFKGNAPGVTVSGKVQATIAEWDVPTLNSLPYDVINTRNGVFYTGLFANQIGRFDPKSQQFEQFPLRPGTRPVSLYESPGSNSMGTIIFTSQTGGYIGEFHWMPGYMGYWSKGDVVVNPVPGMPGGPLHPEFLIRDIVGGPSNSWFTVPEARAPLFPQGGKIGRAEYGETEHNQFADLPTASGDPSGLALNSKGEPFFGYRNSPRIGKVDRRTMYITEYVLPHEGSGVTSVTITRDDAVWYTDNLRGYLGRFDPKTGQFTEWPSPSGPRSLPDAITHVGDVIWYAESGAKPNMLVRFDPKDGKFQTWQVKDGGGIKHIRADTDGSLWFTRPRWPMVSAHVTIKDE